jgi:hypothetical protein
MKYKGKLTKSNSLRNAAKLSLSTLCITGTKELMISKGNGEV